MKFTHTYNLITYGHKTCTARTPWPKWYKWYRRAACINHKIIQAEGPYGEKTPIRLLKCEVFKLNYVKNHLFYQEGFETPEEFEQVWRKIYKSFPSDLDVCTIFFEKLPSSTEHHHH